MKGASYICILIASTVLLSIQGGAQELKLLGPTQFHPNLFETIGGASGQFGHIDGVGTNALFGSTTGLAKDYAGNLYVVDALLGGQTIRKMTPEGVVTTLAGKSGDAAEVDGTGSTARFFQPHSVTLANDGNLYVTDSFGQTIRKVTLEGVVTTLAGLALTEGHVDGVGTNARFSGPIAIANDGGQNLYVADQAGHTLRKVTLRGEVTTLAGMHLARGTNDGVGSAARFSYPRALTMGKDGNIYVADSGSGRIRKVTRDGVASTVARGFGQLTGITSDSFGNLYVIEAYHSAIKKVTPEGVVSTLMRQDGQPARFKFGADHSAILIDQDETIYVADAGDNTILKAVRPEGLIELFLSLTGTDPFFSKRAVTEASTNLTEWLPIETNFISSGSPVRILDTNAPNFQYRFFRGSAL